MKKKIKSKQVKGTHVSGLDIPAVDVISTLSETGIMIQAPMAKREYHIDLEKINNIMCYHEEEFEKYQKTSLIKTLIGAAAFGSVGAIIGSRPKEKTKRTVTFYLVIEYSNKQVVISSEDGWNVGGTIDLFRKLKPEANNVKSVSL